MGPILAPCVQETQRRLAAQGVAWAPLFVDPSALCDHACAPSAPDAPPSQYGHDARGLMRAWGRARAAGNHAFSMIAGSLWPPTRTAPTLYTTGAGPCVPSSAPHSTSMRHISDKHLPPSSFLARRAQCAREIRLRFVNQAPGTHARSVSPM
jgi:hypothetical protein